MNILLTNPMETLSAGGINTTITQLATRFVEKGHKVAVVQGNPLQLKNEELNCGFTVIRVNSPFSRFFHQFNHKMYTQLKQCLALFAPDVVNIHGYGSLLSPEIGFLLKKLMRVTTPVVFNPHYDPLNHNTFSGKHFSKVYDALVGPSFFEITDRVISISNFEANNIQRVFHCPVQKITVIPHGVDRIDARKLLRRKRMDTIDILYAGYLLE